MEKGIFTISLDFELHWGGFEKWSMDKYKNYFDSTRQNIPVLLKAFQTSDVHVTWATVGLLMHQSKEELSHSIPKMKPTYQVDELSAYHFMKEIGIGNSETDDPYHFADSLVKNIVNTPNQELASHSFAHYYCNEMGQSPEQFLADAEAWNQAGKKYKVLANSLVFPRNQFNSTYLQMCSQAGIKMVRTNPVDWWWQIDSTQQESKWKRFNRGLDAYFNIGGKTSFKLSDIKKEEGILLLPASRLLRPFNPKELILNSIKINRIKKEMTLAARNNECYHLWWHPHNFGNYTSQNMAGLIQILNHYRYLNKKYGMISLNMAEITNQLAMNN